MADDSELDYLRTFISEVTTDLTVNTIETKGSVGLVSGAKKCLIVPGSMLSNDGSFYRKRFKIFLNMENEANLTTIMNQIIEGTKLFNKRDTTGKAEITLVTCLAKVDCVEDSTFHFFVSDGAGSKTEYYVWINKGTGSDPTETGTAIEADISGSTTAIDVAEVIDGLIDAKTNVGCDNSGTAILTITNTLKDNITDCSSSEGTDTGFTITINDGGYTYPTTMCNIHFRYSNTTWFNPPNQRWSQTIYLDVEWSTS